MIKLNRYGETFCKKYIDEFLDRCKIQAAKNREFWSKNFQLFMGDSQYDEDFFNSLLVKDIEELCTGYLSVREYFEISFFASIDIKQICVGKKIQEKRKIREGYFQRFCRVGQLQFAENYCREQGYLNIDIIFGTQERFVEFQKYVKREYVIPTNKEIKKAISYEELGREWKVEIIHELGIEVCPYCNRQYVSNIFIKEKGRPLADIDHFYCKSQFSLFAQSLYNFVPSCKICNSIFKLDKNFDILYPYMKESVNGFRFSIKSSAEPAEIVGWSENIKLDIEILEGKNADAISREIELFRLKEQYAIHSEYVSRLLFQKSVWGEGLKEEMLLLINESENMISEDEYNLLVWGYDFREWGSEFQKKPLSKLTYDILNLDNF